MNNQTVKPELKNPEMKAKYFYLHYGQPVFNCLGLEKIQEKPQHSILESDYLELTPFNQITEEDAIEVARILRPITFDMHPRGWKINRTEREIEITHSQTIYEFDIDYEGSLGVDNGQSWEYLGNAEMLHAYDFLRSRGYALPYMGHSVQELIEAGYMKLREGGTGNG